MKDSALFEQEQLLTDVLWQSVRQFKLWIGAFALAGALGAAIAVKYLPQHSAAKASYTLASERVAALARVYDQLPKESTLLLGALEIDELSRFSLLLQHPDVWQQLWSQPALCAQAGSTTAQNFCASGDAAKAAQLTAQWRGGFQAEHKRRGNVLAIQWRSANPSSDTLKSQPLLVSSLVQSAEAQYQRQVLQQLQLQVPGLQQALSQAQTIGERTELSRRLDQVQADIYLWQVGPQPVVHALLPVVVHAPKAKPLLFSMLAAGFAAALLALVLALVFGRR